jgi:hypothetical protein
MVHAGVIADCESRHALQDRKKAGGVVNGLRWCRIGSRHLVLIAVIFFILGGCGSSSAIPAGGGGVSPYALPFQTGTQIAIGPGDGTGPGGLHDDNFHSVPGYTLNGAGTNPGDVRDASLDLLTTSAGVPVVPIAPGRVLSAWPECNMVLVDHGSGVWVTYLHLQVAVGKNQAVGRDTILGRVLPPYNHRGTNCGDWSTAPHVHFAFLNGSGNTGHYVSMAGWVLCGHTVASNGAIQGLGSPGGSYFAVPNCDASPTTDTLRDGEQFVSQSTNPTEVNTGQTVSISFTERNTGNRNWSDADGYDLACHQNCFGVSKVGFNGQTVAPNGTFQFSITFPVSIAPGTYRTDWVMEHSGKQFGHDLWIDIVVHSGGSPPSASSCSMPSLQGPGSATYVLNADITLTWYTDCAQSYVELSGGPYGTLSFGGWQGNQSQHIGQMYPGTYSWHVKGRTSGGNETGWSTTWSFAIAAQGAPPSATNTPIPAATNTPNPAATNTPVPASTNTPVPGPTNTPLPTPTNTPCPYQNNYGQFPTFYAQSNFQGQSVTFTLNPGDDLFFTFPNWLQQNLQSFTDPYGAFHIVTFHIPDHGGNLAHWDASQSSLHGGDGYMGSASVEIYFRRC